MLNLCHEHAKMLAQIDQGLFLVMQSEFDAAHFPLIAAAVREILDRYRGYGRRLLTGQFREIHMGMAIVANADVILHIGEADLGQLGRDALSGDSKSIGCGALDPRYFGCHHNI